MTAAMSDAVKKRPSQLAQRWYFVANKPPNLTAA